MADGIGNGLLSLSEPVTISLMTVTPSERERVMDCIVKVAILVIEYAEVGSARALRTAADMHICTTFRLQGNWVKTSSGDETCKKLVVPCGDFAFKA